MGKPPRILFLCHSASRNGASILLLNLLRWLRPRVDWQMQVLVSGRGPLADDFRAVADTTVLRDVAGCLRGCPWPWSARLRDFLEACQLDAALPGRRFDLVYANTSATWPLVARLRKRTAALLWHIHELPYALKLSMGEERIAPFLRVADKLLAVSRAVQDALVRDFHVPGDKVALIHGFVPAPDPAPGWRDALRTRVREALGWPRDAFVVGGCGSLGWRKGTDLFLQVARELAAATDGGKLRFLWVGGEGHGRESLEFSHDAAALGLADRCRRVPGTADTLDYYCAMDVFALPSREDPFPLVILEAAALGLPVVCFADAGGATEFVDHDAGLVAPYLDTGAFAAHILALHGDPRLREKLGANAHRKVRSHFGIDSQGPRLLQAIEDCLPARSAGLPAVAAPLHGGQEG